MRLKCEIGIKSTFFLFLLTKSAIFLIESKLINLVSENELKTRRNIAMNRINMRKSEFSRNIHSLRTMYYNLLLFHSKTRKYVNCFVICNVRLKI